MHILFYEEQRLLHNAHVFVLLEMDIITYLFKQFSLRSTGFQQNIKCRGLKSTARYGLLLLISIFTTTRSHAQAPADSIDLFLMNKMRMLKIPGLQVAVIKQGKIIKLNQYGFANLQDSVRVTAKTLFPINSITKAFVGVAVMQLVESGKLDLAAPVSLYIDSLPPAWQKVTVRNLLTHTSGLPDIWGDTPIAEGAEKEAWQKTKAMPMDFNTGDRFNYNQTNYLLIGQIIDKLSGQPFSQFIQERQLQVASMKYTIFGDAHAVVPNSARSYTFLHVINGKTRRTLDLGNVYEEVPPFLRTAAGMNSTAHELAQWLISLQNGQLLKNKVSLDQLWTPGILNNGKQGGFSRLLNGYALGWPIIGRAEHRAVAPVGGGRSAIFLYPDDDLAIIILTNLQACNPESFVDELAGYYFPDMKSENGFGLPPAIKAFRAKLLKRGFEKGSAIAKEEKKANANYQLSEQDLNAWGYTLIEQNKQKEALEIFKLNVLLCPKSANVYDSLAEIYADSGKKDLAIENYQKSLTLNPNNQNAKQMLIKLKEQAK